MEPDKKDRKIVYLNLFRDFIGAGIGLLLVVVFVLIFYNFFSVTSPVFYLAVVFIACFVAIRATMSLRHNSFTEDLYQDEHSFKMKEAVLENYIERIKEYKEGNKGAI